MNDQIKGDPNKWRSMPVFMNDEMGRMKRRLVKAESGIVEFSMIIHNDPLVWVYNEDVFKRRAIPDESPGDTGICDYKRNAHCGCEAATSAVRLHSYGHNVKCVKNTKIVVGPKTRYCMAVHKKEKCAL